MRTPVAVLSTLIIVAIGLPGHAQETTTFTCGTPVEYEGVALYAMPYSGLWGFVDGAGDWAITPAFTRVTDFSEGRAIVAGEYDGFWGVIDEEGTWVHEPTFGAQSYGHLGERRVHTPPLEPYSEGCSAGVGPTTGEPPYFLDRSGNRHWEYDPPAALADEEVIRYGSFSEGKAWFHVFTMDFDGEYGWLDAQGNVILPVVYGRAGDFVGGLAPAETPDQYSAFINVDGEPVIPSKWTLYGAEAFSDDIALVKTGPFDLAYIRADGNWAFRAATNAATGESLHIISGGAFSEGLVALTVEINDVPVLVYADEEGNVAFVPSETIGAHVCSRPETPGVGQFRNGLARLMTASDPSACDVVFMWAELADYEGVEYVYVDHDGQVVMRSSEMTAPEPE